MRPGPDDDHDSLLPHDAGIVLGAALGLAFWAAVGLLWWALT